VRIRLGAGTGVDWLMAAMAVADADWRPVLTHGEEAYAAARAAGGRELLRDARRIGRYGWVHLLGPLTRVRGAWSVAALRRIVAGQPASEERSTQLRVIDGLPAPSDRAPRLTAVRARLAEVGPEQLLDEVAPGLHYGAGVLDDVVLVTSPFVAPIVVELGDGDRTVIVHPPLGESARLRDLGRALGDETRMRILQLVKAEPRTMPQLCELLDAPRTTLLHHLALLRGSGLVELTVTAGEPNLYALRVEGFEQLARAAAAFPLS
jgi:DNA-binding transcriptional ArsR family regulator